MHNFESVNVILLMKRLFTLLAAAVTVFSCCAPESVELFNGKDLEGWDFIVDGDVDPSEVYYVEDGCAVISGTPFGCMYTEKEYSDYDLEVEYAWIGQGTNSGIFLNIGNKSKPFPECVECNLKAGDAGTVVLLGGASVKELELPDDGTRPRFPKIDKLSESSENPVGEWNIVKAEVRGGHIKVYVNGVLQNECTDLRTSGNIGLQSEGGALKFRSVRITEVD